MGARVTKRRDTVIALVFLVAFAAFAVYLTVTPQLTGYPTAVASPSNEPFDEGWTTADGTPVELTKLGDIPGFAEQGATIQNRLPSSIVAGQGLNFASSNVVFHVFYDGSEVYSYDPERASYEIPYATTFHFLPLAPADEGTLVTIEVQPLYTEMASQLMDARICTAKAYMQRYIDQHIVALVESAAIFFIGLAIIGLHIALRHVDHGDLDLPALGVTFLLLATWSAAVTSVIQLATGLSSHVSTLEYLSLLFAPYPIARFASSLLQPRRRKLYDALAAAAAAASIVVTIVLAVVYHIDMHSLLTITHVELLFVCALVIAQAVSSLRFHGVETIRNALESNNAIVIAFLVFMGCAIADFVIFVTSAHGTSDAAFFVRHGLFVFAVVIAIAASRASLTYITRAKYADTIELVAYTDALTRMGNRAAWKVMRQEVDTALEQGTMTDAVVCQFDVNFLKKVNDTLGHAAGDLRLKHSAETIRRSYGMEGSCYRTGGDEFTVIIAGDMLDERLRQCQDLFEVSMAEQDSSNESGVPLSMAVGTAHTSEVEPHTVREAQKLADERMYENKRAMKADRQE